MDSRVRASPLQLSTLLEYMETHGDLARPRDGAQGRVRSDQLWSELTNILHSVSGGVNKTTDKWKKVWADWKSKTKKKALAIIRQHARGTGGGPASQQTLSAIDERVLAVMKRFAVEGQASVEELGFNRSQSPEPDDPFTVDYTAYLEIVDETSHLPTKSTSQECQPAAPSTQAPPAPVAPAPPSPPASPSPPAPATPAPPTPAPLAPAAPTTPRHWRPPAPRATATPPSARRHPRLRSPATQQSADSPSRPRLRAHRRRQATTSFERAASAFTTVKLRRLEMEETRMRLQHERDLRALEVEHERIAVEHERNVVEHERNEVFRSLVNVAQAWLDYYRSRDNTERLNTE